MNHLQREVLEVEVRVRVVSESSVANRRDTIRRRELCFYFIVIDRRARVTRPNEPNQRTKDRARISSLATMESFALLMISYLVYFTSGGVDAALDARAFAPPPSRPLLGRRNPSQRLHDAALMKQHDPTRATRQSRIQIVFPKPRATSRPRAFARSPADRGRRHLLA